MGTSSKTETTEGETKDMWMFTGGTRSGEVAGFLSAVQWEDDPSMLEVRTRDETSAKQLGAFCETPVVTGVGTDYPYRVYVTRDGLKRYLNEQVDAISYENFKNQVTDSRGHVWHNALMDVWVAMLKVTPKRRTGDPRQRYSA